MAKVGVYPMHTVMPCTARDLYISPYILPIPHMPHCAQEAAARLLCESMKWTRLGEWMMVSWEQHLHPTILSDIHTLELASMERRLADTQELAPCPHWFQRLLMRGKHVCATPLREEVELPETQVVDKGEEFITQGIAYLYSHGLIVTRDVAVEPDNGDLLDVAIHQTFGPTPELIALAQKYSCTPQSHHHGKKRRIP